MGEQKHLEKKPKIEHYNESLGLAEHIAQYDSMKKKQMVVDYSLSTYPEFPGGIIALEQYFKENVPCIDSIFWSNTGHSHLRFEIDTNGTVIHPTLYNWTMLSENKKEDTKCWDKIKNMPKWIPGTRNNEKVKCKIDIPVKLRDFD